MQGSITHWDTVRIPRDGWGWTAMDRRRFESYVIFLLPADTATLIPNLCCLRFRSGADFTYLHFDPTQNCSLRISNGAANPNKRRTIAAHARFCEP